MSGGAQSKRKQDYFAKTRKMMQAYGKIMVVSVDNVGSSHMQSIRKSLRGKATLLMGKNTLMRKAMRDFSGSNPSIDALIPHVYGNIGLVFVHEDLMAVKKILTTNVVNAYAKLGSISPTEVIVPKGDTGMDPGKTSFFQALSIQTKINKGKIEIMNDINLVKKGEKVSSSQAALLQMLNIKPFSYGCKVIMVYENGSVFDPSILEYGDEDILNRFREGVQRIAALSLAIGMPTIASLPHSVSNAYQKVVSIALATSYSFKQIDELKKLLSDPEALKKAQAAAAASAPAAGGAATTSTAAAPAEEKKKKDDSDDEGGGMGGLFGDDDAEEGGGMGGLFGDEED